MAKVVGIVHMVTAVGRIENVKAGAHDCWLLPKGQYEMIEVGFESHQKG